jgi:tetratricopeptide (TPR) repeat protein
MTTSAHADLERVRQLRLLGELQAAESLAGEIIDQSETSPADEFALRLELARIHDRYGLHFRRRPVTAALAEIDKATELARDLADSYQAQARLARAYYYYRAEMSGREFPVAIRLLEEALVLMPETSDYHDRAEAVHLRGLIHLQMRELDLARQRFDESLELDKQGGARVFFRGEYERHLGLVYIFQDRPELAIPHLEQSLEARIESGAVDASLFAATLLANQRLRLGQLDAIPPLMAYSQSVLKNLDSPFGEYQFLMVSGRYWDAASDECQALGYYLRAKRVAESIDWSEGASQADDYLSRSAEQSENCL